MALPPPPKELPRQRAHDAKYAARAQSQSAQRRARLLARLEEDERRRRARREAAEPGRVTCAMPDAYEVTIPDRPADATATGPTISVTYRGEVVYEE